jgi:hypothetical protein
VNLPGGTTIMSGQCRHSVKDWPGASVGCALRAGWATAEVVATHTAIALVTSNAFLLPRI